MVENLLPLVRKVADAAARRFACPGLDFDELYQIGSLALSEAALLWVPADSYKDAGQAEAHLWLFARPRVFGAMVDALRHERRSRLVRPVEFVPLDDQPEPADSEQTDPAETIELITELYNRFGEIRTEIAVGYAINEIPQHELAKRLGVSQSGISRSWKDFTQHIKSRMEK